MTGDAHLKWENGHWWWWSGTAWSWWNGTDWELFEAGEPVAETDEKEVPKVATIVNEQPKVGRNDPCPCGSGKKYKQCCGKNA